MSSKQLNIAQRQSVLDVLNKYGYTLDDQDRIMKTNYSHQSNIYVTTRGDRFYACIGSPEGQVLFNASSAGELGGFLEEYFYATRKVR